MNKHFEQYYNIKECKKISSSISNNKHSNKHTIDLNLNKILKWNSNNAKDYKYWYEYNPFMYCKFDGEHKKLIQNDYDIEYEYLGKPRTLIDTFFTTLDRIRLPWLVQNRINFHNTITKYPTIILYINLGYKPKSLLNKNNISKSNRDSVKGKLLDLGITMYPNWIKELLINDINKDVFIINHTVFDKIELTNENHNIRNSVMKDKKMDNPHNKMNYIDIETQFLTDELIPLLKEQYIMYKLDLVYCNNIVRKDETPESYYKKVIYIIYNSLSLLKEDGNLLLPFHFEFMLKNKTFLNDVLNILNTYFDGVYYFINNVEMAYTRNEILIIAQKYKGNMNRSKLDILKKYITSDFKESITVIIPQYNKELYYSINNALSYIVGIYDKIDPIIKFVKMSAFNKAIGGSSKSPSSKSPSIKSPSSKSPSSKSPSSKSASSKSPSSKSPSSKSASSKSASSKTTLSSSGNIKVLETLDKYRVEIAQRIIKKYKIPPYVKTDKYKYIYYIIKNDNPINILCYGNISNNLLSVVSKTNQRKNNIYICNHSYSDFIKIDLDTIITKKKQFDLIIFNTDTLNKKTIINELYVIINVLSNNTNNLIVYGKNNITDYLKQFDIIYKHQVKIDDYTYKIYEKVKNKFEYIGKFAGESDKLTHHYYHFIYNWYTSMYENKRIDLLELGVEKQQRSLALWKELLPTARVQAIDIQKLNIYPDLLNNNRIKFNSANQTDLVRLDEILKTRMFDCILDDASHVPQHQLITFQHLFYHHLNLGGIYIIEDIETSYWTDGDLYGYKIKEGLHSKENIVNIFINIVHYVNREFLKDSSKAEVLKKNEMIKEYILNYVFSIQFAYNCIIIQKINKFDLDRKYRMTKKL